MEWRRSNLTPLGAEELFSLIHSSGTNYAVIHEPSYVDLKETSTLQLIRNLRQRSGRTKETSHIGLLGNGQ